MQMSVVLICFGILCLLYELLILLYTRRADTTFSKFWPAFGAANIGLGLCLMIYPEWLKNLMLISIGILWCIFIFVEVLICRAMITKPQKELNYLIVLGAQVRGTKVTNSLERRLRKAADYLRENVDTKVIVSGGRGRGEEITEALAMQRYLEACGISTKRIFMEDKSTTTKENLEYSKKYIDNLNASVGVVTNNFHVYRAMVFGNRQGYGRMVGIVASSNPVLFINYMVREFFAVLQLWFLRKDVDK